MKNRTYRKLLEVLFMAFAYTEKIARINLTTGTITVEQLDTEVAKKFIGGRGLGTKIVYDEAATRSPCSPWRWRSHWAWA